MPPPTLNSEEPQDRRDLPPSCKGVVWGLADRKRLRG